MATISNTPRPGYVWDSTDNVWYPIGVGAHQHTNAADTPAVMPYSTYAAAGKNKLINGDFDINQRAFSSTTTDGAYGFDRWYMFQVGGCTYSAQTFTPGTAPVTGYEAKNYARLLTSAQSASGDFAWLSQRIENVRTFAGQTATISFWAKAASGTPKIAVEFDQQFGNGGSTRVANYVGQVTLSTSWTRYSLSFAVPSISGKTIGTTNDYLGINLWVSAGSTLNSRTGSLGIQNNTFDIWGVQVEAGSTATAFQTATGNPASELAACQRYYFRSSKSETFGHHGTGIGKNGTSAMIDIKLPVTMRVKPTSIDFNALTAYDTQNTLSVTAVNFQGTQGTADQVALDVVFASGGIQFRPYFLISNNDTNGYIGLNAEL